jgi:hypothetical protein
MHWLTIDCTKLPADFGSFGLTGAVSIFIDRGRTGGTCARDPAVKSLNPGSGTALYAKAATNLPSLPQLLRNPSPPIQQWMSEVGCKTSPWSFAYRENYDPIAKAYNEVYFAEDPARQPNNGIYAIVGGWPIEIYEDSWARDAKDPKGRQFAFTYADAEPWVRVWIDGAGEFHVQQIIT